MSKSGQDITLLLIEDDDIDAEAVARQFKKKKISNEIIRVCDGLEALEMLEQGKVPQPYVILLDLHMPRMTGLEFLHALRQHEKLTKTVVFVLTTSQDERDIVASYKEHISGYFLKGHTAEEFMAVIDALGGVWRVIHLPNIET